MLYSIFFDSKGPVLQIPVPKGSSVTGKFYSKVFLLNLLISIRNADCAPPYSPDLSPCDFSLFPRLKEMLAGHRFESRCSIGSAIYQCLQHIPKEDYRAVLRKWVDRCKMCVEAEGAYFEGLR